MKRVTIVYASRHGATRGIATRIGEVLGRRGLLATVVEAAEAPHPATADAVVIGSATYMGKWLDDANEYLLRHRADLLHRPTWLFSSGPIGPAVVDKQGKDLLKPPKFVTELGESIRARGVKVFFGRWDPSDPPATVAERLFRVLPVSRDVLPVGDFRDWPAIDEWAGSIADQLVEEEVAAPVA
jgi:menaquinone-dependent protoporphyrinogen oxidase